MTPSNAVRNVPDGTVYAARTARWTSAVGGIPMVIAVGAEAALPAVVVPLENPFAALCSPAEAAPLVAALEHAARSPAVARSPKPVATWRVRIDHLPWRLVSEVRRDGVVAGSRPPLYPGRVLVIRTRLPFLETLGDVSGVSSGLRRSRSRVALN